MDDFRWGPMSTKHNLQKGVEQSTTIGAVYGQHWEWFVQALDIDRIRSTLSQFPVADTLEPLPYMDVECANHHDSKTLHGNLIESSTGSEDETDDDTRSATESSIDSPKQTSRGTSPKMNWPSDQWRGTGEDLRYSPGFILPLILGALEAFLTTDQACSGSCQENLEEMHAEENIDSKDANIAHRQTFVHISRKLCDKGGISLAIASLSSRCPSIRKIAVAVCGLFLMALQMQESQGIKSWRERPQLEMLMSSMQRGLTVRRSMQMQKLKEAQKGILPGEKNQLGHKLKVPMLPAVSAVFLAKVLMILSRPGDDMYGPMNRYFLRLTNYHGAFHDCFGLPAFLSLYCSSTDDLSRCKIERN